MLLVVLIQFVSLCRIVVENHVANVVAPIHREIIAPIQREVFAPIQREVIEPIEREVLAPIHREVIQPLIDAVVPPPSRTVVVERVQDPALGAQIELTLAEQQRLAADLLKLQEQLNDKAEDDQEQGAEVGATQLKKIFKLAKKIPPRELNGINIALFGINGVGKSSLVNAFTNSSAAPVGPTHSTTSITGYQGSNYTIFDLPGLNDDVSYLDKEYIALLKGASHRVVVVTATVKQMKKLINLFEHLELSYDIVVNKFDLIEVDGRAEFQAKIHEEVQLPEWKHLNRLWFISAAQPGHFPDWLPLIHRLTT